MASSSLSEIKITALLPVAPCGFAAESTLRSTATAWASGARTRHRVAISLSSSGWVFCGCCNLSAEKFSFMNVEYAVAARGLHGVPSALKAPRSLSCDLQAPHLARQRQVRARVCAPARRVRACGQSAAHTAASPRRSSSSGACTFVRSSR